MSTSRHVSSCLKIVYDIGNWLNVKFSKEIEKSTTQIHV